MSVPQANYNRFSRRVFGFRLRSRAGYVDCSRMNVFNIINMSSRNTPYFKFGKFCYGFVCDVYIGIKILFSKKINSQ